MNAPIDYHFVSGGKISGVIDRFSAGNKSLRYYALWMFVLISLCWLPLVGLSFFEHGPNNFYRLFVRDVATHVRFLLALPLLLVARHSVNKSFNATISTFYQSKIIDRTNKEDFEKIIAWIMKWRQALVVDILLIIFIYAMFYVRENVTVNDANFYTPWLMKEESISIAGWWYVLFSLPVLQMILYRWLYTVFLWIIFLTKVSRIKLQLSSLHADGVGGLGFLRYAQLSFAPVAFAISCILAGGLNNILIFSNISINDFKVIIIAGLVFVMLIFVIPMLVFIPVLIAVKKKYYMMYNSKAWISARQYEQELNEFKENGENKPDASLHVDLIAGFEKSNSMNPVLIDKSILIAFTLAVVLPFLPVIAQEIPLKEIFISILSKFLG